MDKDRQFAIGPRTRKNILKGKNIRQNQDGVEEFQDYFSESDVSTSVFSERSVKINKKQVAVGPQTRENVLKGKSIRRSNGGCDNYFIDSEPERTTRNERANHSLKKTYKGASVNGNYSTDSEKDDNEAETQIFESQRNSLSQMNNAGLVSTNKDPNTSKVFHTNNKTYVYQSNHAEATKLGRQNESVDNSSIPSLHEVYDAGTIKYISKTALQKERKSLLMAKNKKAAEMAELDASLDECDAKILGLLHEKSVSGMSEKHDQHIDNSPANINSEMQSFSQEKGKLVKNASPGKRNDRTIIMKRKISCSRTFLKNEGIPDLKKLHTPSKESPEIPRHSDHVNLQEDELMMSNTKKSRKTFTERKSLVHSSSDDNEVVQSIPTDDSDRSKSITKAAKSGNMIANEKSIHTSTAKNRKRRKTMSERNVAVKNTKRLRHVPKKKLAISDQSDSSDSDINKKSVNASHSSKIRRKSFTDKKNVVKSTNINRHLEEIDVLGKSSLSIANESPHDTSKISKTGSRGRKSIAVKRVDFDRCLQKDATVPGKSGLPDANDKSASKIPVRRSNRQRIAPLAPWRNQRMIFSYKDGEINVLGIDEGTKCDTESIKQLERRLHAEKERYKKPARPQKAKIINPNNEPVKVQLLKRFDAIDWDLPATPEQKNSADFHVKRMFATEKTVYGYVKIAGGKEKPLQFLPKEDLLLSAVKGKVEVHVQDNVYIISNHDMVVVPKGIPYKIKNVTYRNALVSFGIGKFNALK